VALTPQGTVLLGDENGALHRSTDMGATWQTVWSARALGPIAAFHPDSGNPHRVLAVTPRAVLETRDDGKTWAEHKLALGQPVGIIAWGEQILVADSTQGVTAAREGFTQPWQQPWRPASRGLPVPKPR
jgi:photosystem II stability/assembly factor-like uncharacterized protein